MKSQITLIQLHLFYPHCGLIYNLERNIDSAGSCDSLIICACGRIRRRCNYCCICIYRVFYGFLIRAVCLVFCLSENNFLNKFGVYVWKHSGILLRISFRPPFLKVQQILVVNGPLHRPICRRTLAVVLCMDSDRKHLNLRVFTSIQIFCNQPSFLILYLCHNLRLLPVSRSRLNHRNNGFFWRYGKLCCHLHILGIQLCVCLGHLKRVGASIYICHGAAFSFLVCEGRRLRLARLIFIVNQLVPVSILIFRCSRRSNRTSWSDG